MLATIILGVAVAWIAVGFGLVASTESRGFLADALFLVTWPAHAYRHLRGQE